MSGRAEARPYVFRRPYSARSALIGLTADARLAGSQAASTDTATRTAASVTSVRVDGASSAGTKCAMSRAATPETIAPAHAQAASVWPMRLTVAALVIVAIVGVVAWRRRRHRSG